MLPGLSKLPSPVEEELDEDGCMPWKVGFAETSGIRNKYVSSYFYICLYSIICIQFRVVSIYFSVATKM